MNVALWLERAGQLNPSAEAIGYGENTIYDYTGLALRAAKLAGALRSSCLVAGDRVAVIAHNHPEYIVILFAIWHAGLVAVPINAKLHGSELKFILEHAGAKACFASPGIDADVASNAPADLQILVTIGSRAYESLLSADSIGVAQCAGDDVAWLFYTSGTTGRPKGAMLSHRSLSWMSHAYIAEVNPISVSSRLLHAAPMSHGSGLYILPYVARAGTNVVPESGGFDSQEIFEMLQQWHRSAMFAAPTMIKRLVECPYDIDASTIGSIVWGGAPMYVEHLQAALERFGPRFSQIYGQGESPMTITTLSQQDIEDRNNPRWLEKCGSVGRPFACVEVAIVDPEGHRVSVGELGEVVCRGDVVMNGYWRDADATKRTIRNAWLHTGDIGAFNDEGYLILKDRSKDLVISGGSNIYPREVEEVLLRHERVREAAIIGRPDDEWGEIVVAYLVGSASADELDQFCLSQIARFKRPKHYVFVDSLPKNNYGKILKAELRKIDRELAAATYESASKP